MIANTGSLQYDPGSEAEAAGVTRASSGFSAREKNAELLPTSMGLEKVTGNAGKSSARTSPNSKKSLFET